MMDITALANSGTTATAAAGSSNGSLGTVGGDEFMQLLLRQLQYQDPFEPMSNEEMVSQIATIRELEVNSRLSDKLVQITDQQRFGSAAALIGKFARGTATDAQGNEYEAEGIVSGVRFTRDGDVMLELDSGDTLALSDLEEVKDAQRL